MKRRSRAWIIGEPRCLAGRSSSGGSRSGVPASALSIIIGAVGLSPFGPYPRTKELAVGTACSGPGCLRCSPGYPELEAAGSVDCGGWNQKTAVPGFSSLIKGSEVLALLKGASGAGGNKVAVGGGSVNGSPELVLLVGDWPSQAVGCASAGAASCVLAAVCGELIIATSTPVSKVSGVTKISSRSIASSSWAAGCGICRSKRVLHCWQVGGMRIVGLYGTLPLKRTGAK
jgi:hypothetical protein